MYNINYKLIKKNVGFYRIFLIVGIILFIFEIFMFGIENILPGLIFLLLPISFIILGASGMKKQYDRLKKVKQLNEIGVLFKNVPYTLERTNMKVNGVRLRKPVVNFALPGGVEIRLEGDPRHDTTSIDRTGMIDVIIDPNNTDNHYIDFNIDRIEGNRPEDYYDPLKNVSIQNAQQANINYNNVKPL